MPEKYEKRDKKLVEMAFKVLPEKCRLLDVSLPDNETFRIHYYDENNKYTCQLFPLSLYS